MVSGTSGVASRSRASLRALRSRHALAVLALGLVVVVAGCGSGGTTATATPDQPAASETPAGTTPTTAVTYPPGVDSRGVTDMAALLSAHRSGLSGQSLQIAIQYEVTTNGSGQRANFSGRVDPAADRALLHVSVAGGTADYYAEGDETYTRQVVDGETSYRVGVEAPGLSEKRLGSDQFVESALRTANFTPSGTVTRDGVELVELTVTDVQREFGTQGRNGTRTIEGRLLVDEDGVVHHVTVRATVETSAGGRYEYGVEVHLTDVGTATVEQPDWLDEARNSG